MHMIYQTDQKGVSLNTPLKIFLFSCKSFCLFLTGGFLYHIIKIIFRSKTHWSITLLGAVCFLFLGFIHESFPKNTPLWKQIFLGACFITFLEFCTGCIVNRWLKWNVWDYSGMSGNILGQVCAPYFLLGLLISLTGIFLDDWLRFLFFKEPIPHYHWK